MERLLKVRNYFKTIRPRYAEFLSDITGVETEIFQSQIPGGMICNMESQLKQQGAGDKLKEVLEEVPRVRARMRVIRRWLRLLSQIVGTQAVFNVLMGKYKVLTGEFADLMLGYYGETLGTEEPRGAGKGTRTREEGTDHLPACGSAEARVGGAARRCTGAEGLQRNRRRCTDLCHVPAGRAEVLRHSRPGAEEPGQGPGRRRAARGSRPRGAAAGAAPARARLTTRSP